MQRYTGIYDDGLFTIRIVAKGGRLYLDVADLGPAQTDDEFASPGIDEFRVRFQMVNARYDRLVFEWVELHSFGRRVQ